MSTEKKLRMNFLQKIEMIFKAKNTLETHPNDIQLEQKRIEMALAEIELRDR